MEQKKALEIGGDIGQTSKISEESMRLDRLVADIEPKIIQSDSPETIAIWLSLTQDQKKAAVLMAEKRKEVE